MHVLESQCSILIILVVILIRICPIASASETEYCSRVTKCKKNGPDIRFPFHLKNHKDDRCTNTYPSGFELFCRGHLTVLKFQYLSNTTLNGQQLSFSIESYVDQIDYSSQEILLGAFMYTRHPLLIPVFLNSSSASAFLQPFKILPGNQFLNNYTFYNCSAGGDLRQFSSYATDVTVISLAGNVISKFYALTTSDYTYNVPIKSCIRMYSVSDVPLILDYRVSERHYDQLPMNWVTPNCGKCETRGEYCKFKNSSSSDSGPAQIDASIMCSRSSTTTYYSRYSRSQVSIKSIFSKPAGVISSALFVALILTAVLYYVIRSHKRMKDDRLRIEMFMNDYKAMKPTRYSFVDIKKITGHFREKLGQGGYGSVYKGQITDEIIVAVKVLNSDSKSNGDDFINEVGTIGQIHHVNVVRLVGYCADGCNRALVYEFQPNDSLQKFTYSEKNHKSKFLGWEKMQEIALGIAKGIEYLHQGCAKQILHFDIKPHNILLDQNFNPKIADFGLAKLCSKDQSIVSMTMARGTIGYIAPEVFSRNFGKVSSKSDVYSFGMLLLEMVGARNNNAGENNSESTYFPEWIYHRLEAGREMVIQIENEAEPYIAKKLTIVGLWCIGWHPVDRPSMTQVIKMLERQGCPPMPPNPFGSENLTPSMPFTDELGDISESE